MSAAATATIPTRPPTRSSTALPEWAQRGNWTPMPNSFFTHVMRACSQFEQAILSLILFRTAGDAQSGRPEWGRLSEVQLARFLDGHPNGVSKAIDRLEDMGAIQSRRVGRAKEYRAIVEAWDKLAPRKPRKLEPKRETADEVKLWENLREIVARVIREQVPPGVVISFVEQLAIRYALRRHWTVVLDRPCTGHSYRVWLDEISKQLSGRVRGKPARMRPHVDPGPDPRQMLLFGGAQ